MSKDKHVQDAHIRRRMRTLHKALISIVSTLNRPQNDEKLIEAAGIRLDRSLFFALVGIERLGPIGVVELAERAGRDYTTVSRQVAKLESLGLVTRRESPQDRRIREAIISPLGKEMTDRIDAAREGLAARVFANWEEEELEVFVKLLSRFADALEKEASSDS